MPTSRMGRRRPSCSQIGILGLKLLVLLLSARRRSLRLDLTLGRLGCHGNRVWISSASFDLLGPTQTAGVAKRLWAQRSLSPLGRVDTPAVGADVVALFRLWLFLLVKLDGPNINAVSKGLVHKK